MYESKINRNLTTLAKGIGCETCYGGCTGCLGSCSGSCQGGCKGSCDYTCATNCRSGPGIAAQAPDHV